MGVNGHLLQPEKSSRETIMHSILERLDRTAMIPANNAPKAVHAATNRDRIMDAQIVKTLKATLGITSGAAVATVFCLAVPAFAGEPPASDHVHDPLAPGMHTFKLQ